MNMSVIIAELVLNKKRFLSQLKKYLINKPFYSLDEYLNSQQTYDERPRVAMP